MIHLFVLNYLVEWECVEAIVCFLLLDEWRLRTDALLYREKMPKSDAFIVEVEEKFLDERARGTR